MGPPDQPSSILPAEYVHWFNNERLHTSIGKLPPVEYEALYLVRTAFPAGEVA